MTSLSRSKRFYLFVIVILEILCRGKMQNNLRYVCQLTQKWCDQGYDWGRGLFALFCSTDTWKQNIVILQQEARSQICLLSCFPFCRRRLPGTLCGFNQQWQLVSRRAPSGQWPKPVAIWYIFLFLSGYGEPCGTPLECDYLPKRLSPRCLCNVHGRGWKETSIQHTRSTIHMEILLNGSAFLIFFSISFCNLLPEIINKPIKYDSSALLEWTQTLFLTPPNELVVLSHMWLRRTSRDAM